jgi:serine/threonine-protein kinase
VLHRDIKPENVFLVRGAHGLQVKLLDFGLSKIIQRVVDDEGEEATQLTRTGITMGTPYYMAPEQAYGARDLDERADVWATGVLLFEACTAKRPFVGETKHDLMRRIVTDAHPSLRSVRADAPPALQKIIDRALQKERDQRFATAAAMQRELLTVFRSL